MATLQKLRQKGPLLALIIGIALLAFILGDLVRSGEIIFAQGQYEIGKVAGDPINIQEYQTKLEEVSAIYKARSGGSIDEQTMEQLQRQMWDQIVRERILETEYQELGVEVSNEELFDLIQGNNIDPTVRQLFTDPNTGQFNRSAVIQFLANLERGSADQKNYWLFMEKEITKNREYQKYLNLISKGLYVTSLEAKHEIESKNKTTDIKYIVENFNSIPDSTINVSNSELSKYYEKNKEKFKQTESRNIEYIVFDVKPTMLDKQEAKRWIEEIKHDFEQTDEVEQFLRVNDPSHPFERKNYKESELPANLAHEMFNAQEGFVYGPIAEGDNYKLVKLVKTVELPDSVHARHILLRPQAQTREAYDAAKKQADSLKTLLMAGADFAKLAEENSTDGSASKGGDLGWFADGSMVRQFNDTCFYSKKGDIKIVETQFGVHIVEVMEQGEKTKKVQIATLNKTIEPSKETIDDVYAQANKFIGTNDNGEKFDKGVAEQGLTKKIATNLTPMAQTIAGLGKARQLIRATYKTELKEVIKDEQGSAIFEFENAFVIAKLTKINEEGYQPLNDVALIIKTEIIKEKKAVALTEKINAKLSGNNNIESLASALGLQVNEEQNVNFLSYQIKTAGYEPKVVGAAASLKENEISKPIEGNSGVFVVQVVSQTDNTATVNLETENAALQKSARARANYQAYEALKEIAKVVDNRAKFY